MTALVAPPISIGGVLPAAVLERCLRRLLPSFAAREGLRPSHRALIPGGLREGKRAGRASARPALSSLSGLLSLPCTDVCTRKNLQKSFLFL
jgi:hypothetical protein